MANDSRPPVSGRAEAVPFPARRAMQLAIWEQCIAPGDNEWTTWSDSVTLAECAAKALRHAGWQVVPLDAEASTEAPPSPHREQIRTAIETAIHGAGVMRSHTRDSDFDAATDAVMSLLASPEFTEGETP